MKTIAAIDTFVKKIMPLLVVAVLAIGYFAGLGFTKQTIHTVKALILPGVIIMIYAMLITMRMQDLVNAVKYPKELVLGSILSLIIAPVLMLPMAILFTRNPEQYAGLMLAGIVPPGGLITYWTGILDADIGLATAIQTVTLLASLAWVPYGMKIFVGNKVNVNVSLLFQKILIMVVVPLALAMITQRLIVRKGGWKGVLRIKPLCHLTSSTMALLICFIATSVKAAMISKHPAVIALPAVGALLYYLLAYPLSYFASKRIFKLPHDKAIPLTYGFATKNLSIAMGLAAAAFGPLTLLGVVPCALFQMPLASVWYKIFDKLRVKAETPSASDSP